MRVAVLGAGPSGLLAAWAVVNAGHEPVIFDKNPRKPDGSTAGVYYLHEPCNLPLRSRAVAIHVSGGADSEERRRSYALKVYGDTSTEVSIPSYNSVQTAYDGMQAMDFCWDIVGKFVNQKDIVGWGPPHSASILGYAEDFQLVINTIPLNILIPEVFWKWEIATIYRSTAPADESYMMYQANLQIPWYRASAIFGQFTLEYPGTYSDLPSSAESGGKYVRVKKVVPSPDAMPEVPENVLLTGRYGAWDKNKLSHDAFYDVCDWFDK